MRTPFAISRSARLLGATLALALMAAPAHAADAPFAPRFAQTAPGDVTAVGNTSMTCPAAAANCAAAQGGAVYSNNDFTMAYVDADADATTTLDSSAATVSLPAGSTVLWAGLYWSGHSSSVNRDKVQFKAPGAGSYTQLTAAPADLLTSTTQAARYRAFRDVTSEVAAASAGTYWVGDVQSTTGTDRFAGWALFVAYRDNAQPIRRLNVYDGLGTVDSTHTFQTTIAPFHTPATGTVTTKAGLLTFEGDAGIASETAAFNGHALSDALNPVGNVMNSTIEAGGASFTAKTPDYANQLGMDLDVYANPGALANDQSSASLAFSSTNEYFMPSAFFLVSHAPAFLRAPRRGPRPQHRRRPDRRRPRRRRRARRPDAERRPRHLERHGHADLRLPVAALRRQRRQLPEHRRRHGQPLHADGCRRRQHRPRGRHGHQRGRHLDAHRLDADRHQGLLGPGERHAAGPLRAGRAGPPADGQSGQLERARAGDLHLPVAALRRQG